jgi:transcriptional regulator with XRE-family HTH domain
MKLLVSRDWLRNKISTDPDVETEAGAALTILEGIGMLVTQRQPAGTIPEISNEKVSRLRAALAALLRQLRQREKLSVAELAERAQVGEDELNSIEQDLRYMARPRALHQLAGYFNVPVRNLMQMSGAIRTVDRVLYDAAVQFAAHSESMSRLTDEERQALNAFVKVLNERGEVKRDDRR